MNIGATQAGRSAASLAIFTLAATLTGCSTWKSPNPLRTSAAKLSATSSEKKIIEQAKKDPFPSANQAGIIPAPK